MVDSTLTRHCCHCRLIVLNICAKEGPDVSRILELPPHAADYESELPADGQPHYQSADTQNGRYNLIRTGMQISNTSIRRLPQITGLRAHHRQSGKPRSSITISALGLSGPRQENEEEKHLGGTHMVIMLMLTGLRKRERRL